MTRGWAAWLLGLSAAKISSRDPAVLTEFGHLVETFAVGEILKQVSWSEEAVTAGGLRKRDSRKTCYCENVKNITVSVPDDVYRNARVTAAQRDTSVSALVVAYLEQLSGRMDEFARLETLQHEVQAGIRQFRASDRMSRDEVHDRAVR